MKRILSLAVLSDILFSGIEYFDTAPVAAINYPKLGSSIQRLYLNPCLAIVINSLQYQLMRKSKENIKGIA
jgi:hypothetical protein